MADVTHNNRGTSRGPAGSIYNPEANVVINRLRFDDVIEALGAGIRDFRQAPVFGMFFGAAYAACGWLILALLWYFDLPFFAYPLAMGFALVAPFFAGGLYEVSRRIGVGEPLEWSGVLGSIFKPERRDLRWMALVTGFALFIWLDIAAIMFLGLLGFPDSFNAFVTELFTTTHGLIFLVVGNLAGAVIATIVYSISVISFPMLFDRDIDFATAMVTSVKTVEKNPVAMLAWAMIIAVALVLSVLSAFAGLIIVLPVLGHATWHLYRRAISSADNDN